MTTTTTTTTKQSAPTTADADLPNIDVQSFFELLTRHLGLYARLKSLVHRQRSLIAVDDPSALLELLADRKRITAELTVLATQLGPIPNQWRRIKPLLQQHQIIQAEEMLHALRTFLNDICSADQHDAQTLRVRKDRVASSLKELPTPGIMRNAYGQSQEPQPMRIDHTEDSI
jgi:hypothetical protein